MLQKQNTPYIFMIIQQNVASICRGGFQKKSKLFFTLLFYIMLMQNIVECQEAIKNKDFLPTNYIGQQWYPQSQVRPWFVYNFNIKKMPHDGQFYIATWKDYGFPAINTTVLRLFFVRNIKYYQKFQQQTGHYQLWATLYNIDQKRVVYLETIICGISKTNRIFYDKTGPKYWFLINYSVRKQQTCNIVFYQNNQYTQDKYGLLISNIKIIKLQRRITRFKRDLKSDKYFTK